MWEAFAVGMVGVDGCAMDKNKLLISLLERGIAYRGYGRIEMVFRSVIWFEYSYRWERNAWSLSTGGVNALGVPCAGFVCGM